MVCMMVILLHHNGAQTQFCHMPPDTFNAAGSSAVIESAAYLDGSIPLHGIIVSLLHFHAKLLLFLLPV